MAEAIRRQFSIYHIRSAWRWPAMHGFLLTIFNPHKFLVTSTPPY